MATRAHIVRVSQPVRYSRVIHFEFIVVFRRENSRSKYKQRLYCCGTYYRCVIMDYINVLTIKYLKRYLYRFKGTYIVMFF